MRMKLDYSSVNYQFYQKINLIGQEYTVYILYVVKVSAYK